MTPDMCSVVAYMRRWDVVWNRSVPEPEGWWYGAYEIWEDAMEFDEPGHPAVGELWPPDVYWAGVDRVTKALQGLEKLGLVEREPAKNEDEVDMWRLRY